MPLSARTRVGRTGQIAEQLGDRRHGFPLADSMKGGRSLPKTKSLPGDLFLRSTLNPQILRRCLAPIRDQLEFDRLPLVERGKAGTLHRRDVDEDVFTAALRLDKAVTLGRIEPFHVTCRHLSPLRSSIG